MILIELTYNLALLVALSVVNGFIDTRWNRNTRAGVLLQGVLFGGATVIGMLRPFVFAPGLVFDGRSVMISLCGLFFGPWAVAVACAMTVPLRLLQGGAGAMTGVAVILASALIGVAFHLRLPCKSRELTAAKLLGFGVAVHLAMLALMTTLPSDLILPVLKRIGWPVMLVYPLATVLIGKILSDQTARHGFLTSLQQSRELLKLVLDTIPQAVFWKDRNSRYLGCNKAFAIAAGLETPAQIAGKTDFDLPWPKVEAEAYRADDQAVMGSIQAKRHIVEPLRQADGIRLWIDTSKAPLMDESGHPFGVLGVYEDITERRKMEDELKEKEQRYQTILQSAMDGFWWVGIRGHLLDVNDAYCRMSGYDKASLLTMGVSDLEAVQSTTDIAAHFQKVLVTGQDRFETKHRRKDGGIYDVEVSVQYRSDASGQMFAFLRDITERKKAELQLRHSHDLMQYIIAHARSAIAVHDRDLRYIFVSERYLEEYKVKERDIIGKHHYEVFPDLPQKWRDVHRRALAGEVSSAEEDPYVREDGSVEWTRWECRPWYDSNGSIGGFIIYTEVITERRKLEELLRQAQKLESIGQLAGGVAHDFNNILAAMMMHLELMQINPNLDSEMRDSLHELIGGTQRAASLTRQLLMFSRRSVLEVKTLDMNEVVVNLLKMLGRLIGEHISLRFDRSVGLPLVEADPGMLEQVLMNLCVNARDAMPKGGELKIGLEAVQVDASRSHIHSEARPGRFVCLSVADTGCGMDDATRQRIFEPFFTTKEVGKGTGLGLATVHGIAGQHKGWVEVESQVGQGATFRVYLPAAVKSEIESIHAGVSEPTRGHETILLVEDEATLRGATAQALRLLGYDVIKAANGEEALEVWNEHKQQIDLLLSDMVMPGGMTGLDLAEKIRAAKPGIKVIISSGYSAEMVVHGISAKDNIVRLQKPYQLEVLSKTIRQSLDRC